MSQKKPAPPWVYVLLTLLALGSMRLSWDSLTSINRANRELIESSQMLDDSVAKIREATAEAEATAWGDGVAYATTASNLTQTAQTPADWKAVEDMWMKATSRMRRVPETDPNYAAAQQRVVTYQKNAEYAKKNAGN